MVWMRRCAVLVLLNAIMAGAQNELKYADAQKMPVALAADSYVIYQVLLPSNAIEWGNVKRTQWLLQDVTTAEPLSKDCNNKDMAGLHNAVKAPEASKAKWSEVVADYDARCHERYKLDGANLHPAVPVHLLDDAAQKRYWDGVRGFMPPANDIMRAPATPNEFKGAAGLHSFSGVYFNHAHTLAAVYFGMGCGSLCGNWTWVVLEKQSDGTWKLMPWVTVRTFS